MFINIFSFYNKNILLPRKNRGGENYGKTKRRKNRCYSAQEKYNIIKPIISGEISEVQLGKELKLSNGMFVRWIDITESKHYNDSIGCITNEETVSELRLLTITLMIIYRNDDEVFNKKSDVIK